uniref:Methyltransferase type 11 domain-containing protein n=1 Tax=Chromera velia CCMP2878 TaxID=1169474 RepID=A0A0G4GPB7_9ALVE|eukprot:Cvel_22790.t1-p1 / transcript=Cvel_22790.t1 / gene=Cvel_22790 / organism=Chromera_velia_CCMP2878 / gene_product=Uncharacterized methyltransferase-like C25B8.10, putative / transcript_product=Uncharacterized methyltransferase-like C25B8.10, putative / location=Cvel_scaffold2279:29329-30276(-) / protein_length=316 / sequence_SO=supercontig / SO=protein_coding / is_pseudo=false
MSASPFASPFPAFPVIFAFLSFCHFLRGSSAFLLRSSAIQNVRMPFSCTAAVSSSVHPVSSKGFDADADRYDRARPGYPQDVVDSLLDKIKPQKILEIASGTGKLTRALVDYKTRKGADFDITAVEPSVEMRKVFEASFPDIPILDASARSLPFESEAFDVVLVGQAFHWFADETVLRELARVCKKGGWLYLIWNLEDADRAQWVKRLRALHEPLEGDAPQFRQGRWRNVWQTETASELFLPLDEKVSASFALEANRSLLWQRVLSRSYVACLSAEKQEALRKEAMQMLDEEGVPDGDQNTFPYPYTTTVACAQKR